MELQLIIDLYFLIWILVGEKQLIKQFKISNGFIYYHITYQFQMRCDHLISSIKKNKRYPPKEVNIRGNIIMSELS